MQARIRACMHVILIPLVLSVGNAMTEESGQPENVTDEITLFGGSSAVYKDAILKFRDLVDISRYNRGVKIISDLTATNIEQCAVDFRYTCDQTATIVERLANGWMEDTKLFFEDPEAMTPEDAKAISVEALKFSGYFRTIRDRVAELAGKLHGYFKTIVQEHGVAVEEAEKAFEKARTENKVAEEARDKAAKQAKEAADTQFYLGVSAFIPFLNLVTLPMYLSAQGTTVYAEKHKDDALSKAAISGKKKDEKNAHLKEIKASLFVNSALHATPFLTLYTNVYIHIFLRSQCRRWPIKSQN